MNVNYEALTFLAEPFYTAHQQNKSLRQALALFINKINNYFTAYSHFQFEITCC
jgi:hypothetical protein